MAYHDRSGRPTSFQIFSGNALHPILTTRASILFYLMIKNHPFRNGNRRIAITTLLTHLFENKQLLKADTQELCNPTVWVAMSPSQPKDQVVAAIERSIEDHLVSAS